MFDNIEAYEDLFLTIVLPTIGSFFLGLFSYWYQKRHQMKQEMLRKRWKYYKEQEHVLVTLSLLLNRHRQMYKRYQSIENGSFYIESSSNDSNNPWQENNIQTDNTIISKEEIPKENKMDESPIQIPTVDTKNNSSLTRALSIHIINDENDDMQNKKTTIEPKQMEQISHIFSRYIKVLSDVILLGKAYEKEIIQNLQDIRNCITSNMYTLSPDPSFQSLIFSLDKFITFFCSLKSSSHSHIIPHTYYGIRFPNEIYQRVYQKRKGLQQKITELETQVIEETIPISEID